MFEGLEKRRFQRLACLLNVMVDIVTVRGETKGLPRQHAKSRNISKGGICLEMESIEVDGVHLLSGLPFAREHRLHLMIELVSEGPPLEVTGEVQWYDVDRDQPGCIYRLGVAFMEIRGDGKERLTKFLKEHQNGATSSASLLRSVWPG
ncbi:MAG: PilZ domain-containing protein [Deltaproteobacteria bacterium]|nr:PilZ domain-containing protein [Deltaproteobacteria bacterium]